MPHDFCGVHLHLHGFAGTRSVPHNPGAFITCHCGYCGRNRFGYRKILVWLGYAHDKTTGRFIECGEVDEKLPEPFHIKQPEDEQFEFGCDAAISFGGGQTPIIIHVPWCEVLKRGERCAVAGIYIIGCHDNVGEPERHGKLFDICLQLVVGVFNGCGRARPFQLHNGQR